MTEQVLTDEFKNRIMNKIGARIKREIIRKCPVDAGDLRRTINYRIEGDSIIFSAGSQDVNYAEYVEYGTGLYHIDEKGNSDPHKPWKVKAIPKSKGGKGFLAWENNKKERLASKKSPDEGDWSYAMSVTIRGMRPKPFMRPAIHQSKQIIADVFKEELSR